MQIDFAIMAINLLSKGTRKRMGGGGDVLPKVANKQRVLD
jgi:hypothetical protein